MKKIFFVLLFTFIYTLNVFGEVIQVGEELTYEVSYLAFKLGTIKTIILPDTNINGEKVYHSKVYIQSNPNIPFYSLKTIFNSYMSTTLTEGRYFECNSKEQDQEWGFQKITFRDKNNENGDIHNEKWYAKEKINDTTYYGVGKVFDGSTLFFFARENANQKKNIAVKTIMDLDIAKTYISFKGTTEKVKIDAIKEPINTYYLEGHGDWKALYGLGGKFQGWFSADDARVPIKAKMNVYLGSINIELVKWKRNNWNPPK